MKRDRRLTGYLRGQRDGAGQPGGVNAPPGFELNNPWGVCSDGLIRVVDLKSANVKRRWSGHDQRWKFATTHACEAYIQLDWAWASHLYYHLSDLPAGQKEYFEAHMIHLHGTLQSWFITVLY